jgi:diacylglycerol kinase family enzyme
MRRLRLHHENERRMEEKMKILIMRAHKPALTDMFEANVDAIPRAGEAIHYSDEGARYGRVLAVEHDARFGEHHEHPTTIVHVEELQSEEFYKLFNHPL